LVRPLVVPNAPVVPAVAPYGIVAPVTPWVVAPGVVVFVTVFGAACGTCTFGAWVAGGAVCVLGGRGARC